VACYGLNETSLQDQFYGMSNSSSNSWSGLLQGTTMLLPGTQGREHLQGTQHTKKNPLLSHHLELHMYVRM
jgi:hypothetical protein